MAVKSKILLLFCGGTISMRQNPKTLALEPFHNAKELLEMEPRLNEMAEIDIDYITNIDSTNIDPSHWEQLINRIAERYDDYSGFVITHGTNTLGYTSSALSFALAGIGKPVVVTGAQIPAEKVFSDGRNNLINSIRLSQMNISGVFVVFGTTVIRGSRAKKTSDWTLDAFDSFRDFESFLDNDIGKIGAEVRFSQQPNPRHGAPLQVRNGFNRNVASLTCFPGMNPDQLRMLIESGIQGIILRGFGPGDTPDNFLPALELARTKQVPVVVTTQCSFGTTHLGINEPGARAKQVGVIEAFDMSIESITTKMMWLLHQGTRYKLFGSRLQTPIVGEIKPPYVLQEMD